MTYVNTEVLLISRPKLRGPGTHEGVLTRTGGQEVVYDKSPRGIRRTSLEGFAENREVTVTGQSPDAGAAVSRLRKAIIEAREFVPWGDNCQHFAREVVFGRAESPELQALGWTVALLWLFRGGEAA